MRDVKVVAGDLKVIVLRLVESVQENKVVDGLKVMDASRIVEYLAA